MVSNSKILRFIKEQEASGLLLRSNSPFSIIPLIGSISQRYKMNEIVNNFSLASDKFIPGMNLR